jgi:hypothetical protein
LALLTAVATVLLSCGEKDVGPGDPRSELEVVVATTGEDLDADGYAVILDGATTRSVGVNGTVTFSNLTPGSHSVELLDVAGNCAAGVDPDPDGYVVIVRAEQQMTGAAAVKSSASSASDSDQSQPVAVNGTVTFHGLAPGEYTVQLDDVVANCAVVEANPATASLPPSCRPVRGSHRDDDHDGKRPRSGRLHGDGGWRAEPGDRGQWERDVLGAD